MATTYANMHEAELKTSAGDKLIFRSLSTHEEISQLFEFHVTALSKDPAVLTDAILGTAATVKFKCWQGDPRCWSGIVASYGIDGSEGGYHRFRLVLRPWLWLATRRSNLRIFQDQNALDIVKAVFNDYPFSIREDLQGSPPSRIYCVQYRESDFNFVARLLEEEGIFWFFEHSDGAHKMVLSNKSAVHVASGGADKVVYQETPDDNLEIETLVEWVQRHEIQTNQFAVADYDPLQATVQLRTEPVNASSPFSGYGGQHEAYDYPGRFLANPGGTTIATHRLQAETSRHGRFFGQGNSTAIVTGRKFKLDNHPRTELNRDYVAVRTNIDLSVSSLDSGAADESSRFLCQVEAQRLDVPYAPLRLTRKPTVAGPQTAVVVGDGDAGDITTDEHGRIKVQFHWDRLGEKNANSSCWLRVASMWAGNGWGMISLPRLGQEVVVGFLEGDPDQPLVIGSVYNSAQKTPYPLPDNATVSTVKSRSKQGGADEFNEIRFEDKPGNEYVLMHAQKDRIEFVEETVHSEIGKDQHHTVKNDRKQLVEGTEHLHVKGVAKAKYDDALHLTVAKDMLHKSDGLWALKTAKDITAESGTAISFKAGTDMHVKVGKNLGVDSGMNVHIKGGMNIVLEGGMQVTIKAGGSSVVLGPDGVSITGAMVKINSGGSPGSGNGASPVAPTAPQAPDDPEPPEDPLSHR